MKKNQIEVISNKNTGMRISRGETTIDFSPEATERICSEIISLGQEFIAETSKMTVEYFQTQANMYYAQLNAYISVQAEYSKERNKILDQLQDLSYDCLKLIMQTEDKNKIDAIKKVHEDKIKGMIDYYTINLEKSIQKEIPKRRSLLKDLKQLFSNK